MAFKNPFTQKSVGLLGSFVLKLYRQTIDWKAVYCDPTVDPVHPNLAGRYVYACWHETMLMPIVLRAKRKCLALASEHGDGELISRAMQHLGFSVVRGSSTRGGTAALLRLLRDDERLPSITPDGPRGPRRQMSPGAIFLASKVGLPLVCVGYGYDRPWRTRSWDRFAVPRPFSRCRAIWGPPVTLPRKLDRDQMEAYRRWFERLLNWLTDEAERWAESGTRKPGELPMLPGQAAPRVHTWTPAHAPVLPNDLHNEWTALGNRPLDRNTPAKIAA